MHQQSGLIVAGREKEDVEQESAVTPSLAYLSARLQFGKDDNN